MHTTSPLASCQSGLSLLVKTWALPAIIALSALATPVAKAQPNLLQAGDFEGISSLTSYWPATAGVWGTETSVLSGAVNGVTPFGSQMLSVTHGGGGGASQTSQTVEGPFLAGSVVTFTTKFNTWLTGKSVALVIQTDDGLLLNGPRYQSPSTALDADTSTWQTVTWTTTLTSDTNYISAEIILWQASGALPAGTPQVYADDAVLTVVPPLPTQTLTILGGSGSPGTIAPNVEYYNPATGNWQPAYLTGWHPWGFITGTNSWINYKTDTSSDPGAGLNGTNSTYWYLYRVRFTVPADAVNPQMTFSANADNFTQVAINGVTTGGSTQFINNANMPNVIVGGPGVVVQFDAGSAFSQNVHPGENTITLNIGDWGGLNGFNFRIDLSMQASQPLEIVPPEPADSIPPVIAAPADITTEATGPAGAVVSFAATANDDVDGPVGVLADPASGSTFPLGTTVVDLGAADSAGNIATASFNVTVQDTTPPIITAPANVTAEATSASGATATYSLPGATDIVSGSVAVVATQASGSAFPLGATSVGLSATDAAGNAATASFTVTVVDTTAPALSVPANVTAEATSASGATVTYAAATATDAVGVTSLTHSPASGSTFALGATTVTVTATDAAGNTNTGSFTVTVVDTTAPTLSVPANITAEATSASGATVTYAAAIASDAVGVTSLTHSPASGSTFPLGTTTVTVTASDAAGNTSTGSFTVTVVDTTAPVISSVTPSIRSIWPPNKKMVPITLSVASTDAVGLASTQIISIATNQPDRRTQWAITGPLTVNLLADRHGDDQDRIYTITIEVRDAAGNVSTATTTVTVPHDQRHKDQDDDDDHDGDKDDDHDDKDGRNGKEDKGKDKKDEGKKGKGK